MFSSAFRVVVKLEIDQSGEIIDSAERDLCMCEVVRPTFLDKNCPRGRVEERAALSFAKSYCKPS